MVISKELKNNKKFKIKIIATIAIISSISAVLEILNFPVPIAPAFMKMDISELPAVFLGLFLNPVAGFLVIVLKNLIKLIFKPTSTVFVGELVNVLLGSVYVLIASLIYKIKHTKIGAILALFVSTILTSFYAAYINATITFPMYSTLYNLPMKKIIEMGTQINPNITDTYTLMLYSVMPFNLIKFTAISILAFLLYKKIGSIVYHIVNK